MAEGLSASISLQGLSQNNDDLPPFARAYEHLSIQLRRFVASLSRFMTIQDVANHTNLSWNTVKDIVKERLKKEYNRISYNDIRYLAIDEIYLGKRKKFVTTVIDQETGRIIWVANGRGQSALMGFWKKIKSRKAQIVAVAMDMSGAYAASVRKNLSKASIVFDRFHVVKNMNKAIDDIRRDLVGKALTQEEKLLVKGKRWLLLYRRDRLDEDQSTSLQELLDANQPLSYAYILKEELNLLWEQASYEAGAEFLSHWCAKARATKIKQLERMAKLLERHWDGVLSYFHYKITNARLEGINRKIKTLLRQVYGLRDEDFFKLKLYALHEAKHQLL